MKNFEGWQQIDGYKAYNKIKDGKQIRLLACMAHARSKFELALENDQELEEYALSMIRKLYVIERKAREENLSCKERKALREQESMPVFTILCKWLKSDMSEVFPKSSIGIPASKGYKGVFQMSHQDGQFLSPIRPGRNASQVSHHTPPILLHPRNRGCFTSAHFLVGVYTYGGLHRPETRYK